MGCLGKGNRDKITEMASFSQYLGQRVGGLEAATFSPVAR
jgi:hypothetical protein